MDPTSANIRDVGIPGLTLHEANVLHAAAKLDLQRCFPGIPGLLNIVVAEESETFWPVLGNFTKLGAESHRRQRRGLEAIRRLRPSGSAPTTYSNIWAAAGDSSAATAPRRRPRATCVRRSQRCSTPAPRSSSPIFPTSSKPATFSVAINPQTNCRVQDSNLRLLLIHRDEYGLFKSDHYRACSPKYHLDNAGRLRSSLGDQALRIPDACPEQWKYSNTRSTTVTRVSSPTWTARCRRLQCKPVSGKRLGKQLHHSRICRQVECLNKAINQGIGDAARAPHVPLVDVDAIFHGIASGDPSNPYFKLASSINPGVCCTLGYLYGMLSFDGLHPSNTGYALIAYEFISTINKAYGTHIPQSRHRAVYDGKRCSNAGVLLPRSVRAA